MCNFQESQGIPLNPGIQPVLSDTDTLIARAVMQDTKPQKEISEDMPSLVQQVHKIMQTTPGPGIVFARTLAMGRHLALGLQCPLVTGAWTSAEKAKVQHQLQNGLLRCAVATATWYTGVDIPPLRWAAWAGEGTAPIGLQQSLGRLTRTCDGKESAVFYLLRAEHSEAQARALKVQEAAFILPSGKLSSPGARTCVDKNNSGSYAASHDETPTGRIKLPRAGASTSDPDAAHAGDAAAQLVIWLVVAAFAVLCVLGSAS